MNVPSFVREKLLTRPSVVSVQMRCHFSTQNVKSAIALLATQTDTVRCWLLEESSVKLSWQIRTSDTGIRVPIGADGRQDIPARKRRCVLRWQWIFSKLFWKARNVRNNGKEGKNVFVRSSLGGNLFSRKEFDVLERRDVRSRLELQLLLHDRPTIKRRDLRAI